MQISNTMDLGQLAERIGDTCGADVTAVARRMRALLVEDFNGEDTADVPERTWAIAVEAACATVEADARPSKRGVYSDNGGDGRMLAFGATDAECFAALQEIGGEYDPSEDDTLRYVDVTDALAETDGGWWGWLPGSGKSVACTRDEADE